VLPPSQLRLDFAPGLAPAALALTLEEEAAAAVDQAAPKHWARSRVVVDQAGDQAADQAAGQEAAHQAAASHLHCYFFVWNPAWALALIGCLRAWRKPRRNLREAAPCLL
jgi:hypothetical protein